MRAAGQGGAAETAVVRHRGGDHRLDDRGAFPVSELTDVEVARHPVDAFDGEPAQEDVGRRCHQVLAVDDSFAVRAVSARSDELLEHRRLGLFGLKEQRIVLVPAEHQQDPCPGTDAPHPDDLESGVDQVEVLEKVAAVGLEGAAVAADQGSKPAHDLLPVDPAEELIDGLDEGRVADDPSIAVDDVCQLVERLHAVRVRALAIAASLRFWARRSIWSFICVSKVAASRRQVAHCVGGVTTPPCGAPAECRIPYPVLQVSGLQHLFDQPEEPVIMDFLRQDVDHCFVVETPETVGDVSLDKPGCPGPCFGHFAQRGVAAAAGAETVGTVGELRLVVRLQQEADHFADEFIRPGRQAERLVFTVLLRYVCPLVPGWNR